MRSFLFNEGYFYAKVLDTTKLSGKKARVTYQVETGRGYLINRTILDVDDSAIKSVIRTTMRESILKEGTPFSMTLLEQERARVAAAMRNEGYYYFSTENIYFEIDTVDKRYLKDIENPFESAINFLTLQREDRKPTLDVRMFVRAVDDTDAYRQFSIGRIRVYPDFVDRNDYRDSSMLERRVDNVLFRYHNYYINEGVVFRNIFLSSGQLFTQDNYDRTVTRLNDLGVFQYVRISLNEDTTIKDRKVLRCTIYMSPAKRYDFNTNFEVSSASTYTLGSAVSVGIRNRNLLRGANQLAVSVSGGIETIYDDRIGDKLFSKFAIRSRNIGANASLSLPKFVVPFNLKNAVIGNIPRTVINVGTTLLERLDYFTLTSTTASFGYNWRETSTKTWDLTPVFVNVFTLPKTSIDFQKRLDTNAFLANSYREVTIEGENAAFTFSNNEKKRGRNYSYVRVSGEEAGALFSGISRIGEAINNRLSYNYAQYLRLDADGRHFFTYPHSTVAVRLATGIGVPYGNSTSLPYVKQYFAGGAYSIRGWRVRTLGPGSYYDPKDAGRSNLIDRTGDIRLESSVEYRFDIVKLFAGSLKLAGATFVDAGNIWLARADSSYPGGEFRFSKLGRDIAASTGMGARLNIGDFITFRADAAFPVKKPYSPNPGGWVIKEVDLFDPTWRAENLVLSFAIGYPF
jgi:outer membrane protein assembly factor BamA